MSSFYIDYDGKLKMKKDEKKTNTGKMVDFYVDYDGEIKKREKEIDAELAPSSKKKDSKLDFFKKSSYFDDGYQLGDFTYALTGTVSDFALSALEGIAGMGEGILDLGGHLIAGGADLLGADDFADDLRKVANHNTVAESADWLRDVGIGEGSVLGRTSQAIGQGAGQIAGILLTGGAAGAAGLGTAATSALTSSVMFASSTGAGISEAYNDGASDAEAWAYGTLKGGIDAASELIFGGLGKGVKALGISHGLSSADDILAKKLSSKISSKLARTMVQAGVKAGAEGFEEVLAGLGTAAAKMIYKDGVSYQQLLEDENLLEQFVVGTFSSGLAQSGGVVNSVKTGSDFISGLNQKEEAVVNKEVEKRIAQEEANGKKLTNKEKNAIYDDVVQGLDKGYISIDTIEEALGGDSFKAYQDAVKSEDAIKQEYKKLANTPKGELTHIQEKRLAELEAQIEAEPKSKALKQQLSKSTLELAKGSRLIETYNEQARRSQAFQADLTKYDAKQAEIVKKAIDSGILNNTNRTHEFVDLVAKISADKGVSFDFANNTKIKESGFAVDGATVNGFVTDSGITVNIQSAKALNTVVGHEITHILEGTELYDGLQKAVVEYAKTKGEYDSRLAAITKLYEGKNADINKELVADLVGDYLFTDSDFVARLSTENRNVFEKIYDEIKYLLKVATAGSKEAKQFEKAKRAFEKAYRESKAEKNTTKNGDVKYDLERTKSMSWEEQIKGALYGGNNIRRSDTLFVGDSADTPIVNDVENKPLAIPLGVISKAGSGKDISHSIKRGKLAKLDVGIKNAPITIVNPDRNAIVYVTSVKQGGLPIVVSFDMNTIFDGDKVHKATSIHLQVDIMAMLKSLPESATIYAQKNELDSVGATNNLRGLAAKIKLIDNNLSQNTENVNNKLNEVGLELDTDTETVSYSLSSLEESFDYNKSEEEYWAARTEYANALAQSIAEDKGNPTAEEIAKANRYLDSLFLIHDMIAADKDRLDYEAAVNRSAWVGNSEYGGSIDFSTLCAKRRLFTGTFDAIQNALPDTVLNENDFLQIRNMLLEKELESPCSMCYVEGSRAKHGEYVARFLKDYLKTNPEWKPQIADFTSTTRLEQTRIQHPEAFAAYQQAMNKLAQRKPKEASVRTDYKGEILRDFANNSTVAEKNKNGGVRFNSFSDFEIIHALDCMQVLTDMARVGLNGQSYTKVKEFAEAFGNTGLKINLSLVAKDVDANGKLIMDETNGMKYAEAMDIRNRYSENVGTVIVVFNEAQLKAALADPSIDFVLPFHRSQWKKSQYTMMGLPTQTKDYTMVQNDRITNPATGKPVKLSKLKKTVTYTNDITGETFEIKGNIMPNQYWDFSKSGRENAQRYLDFINANGMTPKFDSVLEKVDGKWVLPDGEVGDGYFKLLIDFKMYNNDGWGAPQNPVTPDFNMPYIQQMLDNYVGGHKSFPVAHDVVDAFVESKKGNATNTRFSLSEIDEDAKKVIQSLKNVAVGSRIIEGYATYTKERMEREIRSSIASGVPDYAQSYITWVNPLDFVYATTTNEKGREQLKQEAGTLDIERLKRETQPIHLTVNFETGDITGHEGRHRMLALYDAGINKVPVIIDALNDNRRNTKPIEMMKLNGQKFAEYQQGTDFYLHNMLPLSERYADVARQVFVSKPKSGIQFSLSNVDEEIAPSGNYNVYGKDIALQEDIAPVQEDIAQVREDARATTEDVFSDDPTMIAPDDTMDRLQSFTDADAPIFAEPVTDSIPSEVADPFAHKDIKEVGQRNVKAFMRENPDIKPFFQAEANNLLGELERTVKGKRYYSEEGGFTGTSRHTSEDIAYLLDELKMSYKDIEASLNAIISGEGNINRAAIKRIEFIINDRLMKGYTDFETGVYVQPNQQYINALNQMQQMEAYQDSIGNLMEIADEIAPTQDTRQNLKAEIPFEHLAERAETIEEKQPILNVKQRIEAKLKNLQNELAEIERQRQESWAGYDADIADLKKQYNEKRNKNTQTANNLLLRIERTETRKQNTDDLYNKRINSVKESIAKVQEEIKAGESPKEQAAFRAEYYARIIDNIKDTFANKGYDFDAVLAKAKNLSTIATVDNTPQRVMEKTLGYKEGQILADLTVNKTAQDETEGIKWLNKYFAKKSGEIVKISNEYHIKPGSKESAAAQMYGEGFYVNENDEIIAYGDRELAMDFPNENVRNNIKKLAKDTRIRQIYDETLNALNESRVRNGYPEIKRLDNYFLHYRAQTDTYSRLGLPFNPNDIKAKDLPTDLNGVTADLKPGQPFFASAMHRKGKRTSFDLLGGLEQYLTAAKNQIYHIDNIQTLRALRNYIADTYGQAKGLENLDLLTEEEAEARIKEVYGAHLSTFAKFLNEEANVIAGKTALIDRGLEGIIGRRGITLLDSLNKQVGANMIGFNISSSLTNLIAAVQGFAKTNKFDYVKGMAQTVQNRLKSIKGQSDGFMEQSPVAIRREGADRFARTPWQKVSDVGYIFMSAVDSVATELNTRAKYNELTRKGMSSEQAHIEADKWVSRLMGDRSLGQQPQLYNSKTLGIITKFQLEVRNQLDAQFYDTIQEAKLSNEEIENSLKRNAKTAAKVTRTFVELAVLQHLFGKAFESVAGYNPAFDIISAIIKAFGWDDDEDDDDTIVDNLREGAQELLDDLPYTSVLTGGRVPIASALPDFEGLVTGKDKYGSDKSILETLTEPLPYYLMPGGYGQLKKTTQGLGMFDDDLPIAGSYTDSGNLRFPVEKTFGNVAQAALFGQWASQNARDYFDNEYAPLKEKQIQEFIDLDIPIKEYREIREDLADKSTLGEKVAYIATLDLPIDKKNILVNNAANREEAIDMSDFGEYDDWGEFDYAKKYPDKYAFLQDNGISVKDYQSMDKDTQDAWNWAYQNPEKYSVAKVSASDLVTYRQYSKALGKIEADKDEEGKSITGSRKEKVIDYINSIDADYGSKIILFKSEYPADDTYNQAIVEYVNNRQDITYEDRVAIFTELGFTIKNGSVYWD